MITLNKSAYRDFTVLHLTDLHIMPEEWKEGHEIRRSVENTIEKLLERVNPDLITHGGDFAAAEHPECYTNFARLLDSYGIPFTTVWGNHDNQCGEDVTRRYAEEFLKCKNFVYEHGPSELGNGNFVIGIRCEDRIVHGIVLMDTHNTVRYRDKMGDERIVYDRLHTNQLLWYEEAVKELSDKGCQSTTLMLHHPIYAYKKAFNRAYRYGNADPVHITYRESLEDGCWNDGYESSFGVRYEGECTYPEDDGVLSSIKRCGSTRLVLCGHDHVNCYCVEYEGIRLMYGLKTGRGSYFDERLCGGTVIEIDSDGNASAGHLFV